MLTSTLKGTSNLFYVRGWTRRNEAWEERRGRTAVAPISLIGFSLVLREVDKLIGKEPKSSSLSRCFGDDALSVATPPALFSDTRLAETWCELYCSSCGTKRPPRPVLFFKNMMLRSLSGVVFFFTVTVGHGCYSAT